MIKQDRYEDDSQRIVKFTPEGFWSPAVAVTQCKSLDGSVWRKPCLSSVTVCELKPSVTAAEACYAMAEAFAEAGSVAEEWAETLEPAAA